jgi:lipopolysaccharide/colanic/teichoic acid biosynthesis glycosyltransferase
LPVSGEDIVNVRRSFDSTRIGPFAANPELAHEREILNEVAFHRVISIERRRTERSRKPFLLMLLDLGDHSPSESITRSLGKVIGALSASTRATDIPGWYQSNCVVGVMFTEIAADDRGNIVSTMIARLSEILRDHMSLEQFNRVSVSFHLFPDDWEGGHKHPINPILYPDLAKRTAAKRISGALKRAMDIVGSILALMLGAPLFLIIAVAIKATSKGSVFFRQKRIGQYGTPFIFLKFRSMTVDNDDSVHQKYVKELIAGKAERQSSNGNGAGAFKLTNDRRITPLGAFLRKTSLDELPQFFNVLKGDMSLVGPRPPIAYEVASYDYWHRRRLLEAKPGITGLWQVSGRSRVTFDEMVRLDLRYARSCSPWMDLKILLRTPLAVVLGEGAH